MKKIFVLFTAAFILLLAPAARASTSAEATNLSQIMQNNMASGYNTPYGSKNFPAEEINPIDGGLILSATDLYLEGKNGLNVELKRVFNSATGYYGIIKSSTSHSHTPDAYAYPYCYTLENGNQARLYVAFASESHMLGVAPEGFYSTSSVLNSASSLTDDKGRGYYNFYKLKTSTEEVWLERDVSAEPRSIYFETTSYFYWDNYENPSEVLSSMWTYTLPYMTYSSYSVGTNSYEGYGMFVDYNGEAHTIELYYDRSLSNGVYTYSGNIDVLDSSAMSGIIEYETYANDSAIEYRYKITDDVGRTLFFNKAGQLRVIEDRFGNYIKYYYDAYGLSKIIDTFERTILFERDMSASGETYTVTVDADNDGTVEKKIVYSMNFENDPVLDPNNYLTCDTYGTFKVSIYDDDGTCADTVYEYNSASIAHHRYSTSYTVNEQTVCYNITSIQYPNGLKTEYTYYPTKRYIQSGFYVTKNMVIKRLDIDNGNTFNETVYSYGSETSTSPTVTETNSSKDLVTTYSVKLNPPSQITKKVISYDTAKFQENYTYNPTVNSKTKMKMTKLVQYRNSNTAKYTNTMEYTYSSNRLSKSTQNSAETIYYAYHSGTGFLKTKTYSVSDKRYIKEEYILNDTVDGDLFKNRNVERINVYESTDSQKTYVLKETTSFTYDSYGNMSSQTLDPDGQSITSTLNYSYENGNIITQYTSPGLVNADGAALSSVTTVSVTDSFGHNISSTDGNGNTSENVYDFLDRITSAVDALGNSDEYEYDIPNRTLIHTAKNGLKTKVIYDGFGNVLKVYKMYNNAYRLAFEYVYDAACRPVTAVEYVTYSGSACTQKLTTAYTWTKDDRVLTKVTTDISGNVLEDKTYSYEYVTSLGTYTELTDHDAANKDYRPHFCAITLTQPTMDGITPPTITEYYDVKGRLVKRKTVDGDNKYLYTCIYDHLDRVTEEKDEYAYLYGNSLDFSVKTVYDYKGRAVEVYNAEGNSTTYSYDSVGNLISETDAMGNTKTYTYDGLGRMLTKSVPFTSSQTSVTKYYYDGNNNLTKSTIPSASRTESYTYDALNRPVTAYDGRYYTKYIYDVMGNVTKSVSGLSSASTNISSYAPTSASYTVVNYTYDKFGNMLTKTDALGTTTYTYDFSGRQLTAKAPGGVTTTNTYSAEGLLLKSNAGGDLITNTYDFWGNLKTTKRGSGAVTTYTYDNMFNMVKETQGTTVKDYTYDGLGNLLNFKLTYGDKVLQDAAYTYDMMGRMATANDGKLNVVYTYNANGNLISDVRGDVETYYEYNQAGLLTTLTNNRTSFGDEQLSKFTQTYFDDGNVRTLVDERIDETTQTNRYTYRNNGELSYAYLGDDTYYYVISNRGNRASSYRKDSDGVYHRTYNIYTTGNRISSAYSYDSTDTSTKYDVTSYTYDANGNTLTTTVDDVTSTKTYSKRNETSTFTDGTTSASYTYGADGLRTSKTVNGTETEYIWSGGNIVAEIKFDSNGNPSSIMSYFYGLNRISQNSYYGGGVYTYIYDTHGNVVQKLRAYINSTVDYFSYHYDAFGNHLDEERSGDINPFRYCGEYWDKETGEVYLRARYYSPITGRFTTQDTHWNADNMIYGDEKNTNNYISSEEKVYYIPSILSILQYRNLYVYCISNPIMYIDKTGNDATAVLTSGMQLAKEVSMSNPMLGPEDAAAIVVAAGTVVAAGATWIYDKATNSGTTEATTSTTDVVITNTQNDKKPVFPVSPIFFQPKGLSMNEYEGTGNGKIIKWVDSNNITVFEWDEDLKNGSHYHVGPAHDGTHYKAGEEIPEPYASIYF